MYGNPEFNIERLTRQKEEIENLIKNYKSISQAPVNNFITSSQPQTPQKDMIEWRILNENEEVDNLYVNNKTLFISDNLMVLKGVDGSLEKWEVKKIYPIDKKDQKINDLEEKVKELEMKLNEPTKPNGTVRKFKQPDEHVDVNANTKPKASSKSIQE